MNVFFHKCFCYLLVWICTWFGYHADLFVVGFNSTGKLSSSVNVVDMRLVSRRGLQKVGSGRRCFRVHALFGGKKDNEGPVSFLFPSMLHMSIYLHRQQICILDSWVLLYSGYRTLLHSGVWTNSYCFVTRY